MSSYEDKKLHYPYQYMDKISIYLSVENPVLQVN